MSGESLKIRVLFFGRLREIAGRSEDTLALAQPASLGQVLDHYTERLPALSGLRGSIVLARNREFSRSSTALNDGDEVALLPPVSGGSGSHVALTRDPNVALTRELIDVAALSRLVAAPSDGAVVTFEGIVRNNTSGRTTVFLEYESYEPMALQVMAELAHAIAAKYAVGRVAMVHRLGRIPIGEASVAIAVSAPHRKAALDAVHEAIDTLKRTVPIWKKEFFEDGAIWVDGEWDGKLSETAPV